MANASDSRASHHRGFTLVELLVVVSIIALLIAILLPALSEARWVATRVRCATNVHGLLNSLAVYATDYNDKRPLGYHRIWNCGKQYNYVLSRASGGNIYWINFGYLYRAEAIPEPRNLYCPANEIPMLTYNYEGPGLDNPWPPSGSNATRVGYGTRPMVPWVGMTSEPSEPLPKSGDLKPGTAVLGDIVASYNNLELGHQRGVNMGYADGGVQWVPRQDLEPTISLLPPGFDYHLDDLSLSDDPSSLWRLLDRD